MFLINFYALTLLSEPQEAPEVKYTVAVIGVSALLPWQRTLPPSKTDSVDSAPQRT